MRRDPAFAGVGHTLEFRNTKVTNTTTGSASFSYAIRLRAPDTVDAPVFKADAGIHGVGRLDCTPAASEARLASDYCQNEGGLISAVTDRLRRAWGANCSIESSAVLRDFGEISWWDSEIRDRLGHLRYEPKRIEVKAACRNDRGEPIAPKVHRWSVLKLQAVTCPVGFTAARLPPTEGQASSFAVCSPNSSPTAVITGTFRQIGSCPANAHPCHPATGDKSRAEVDFSFAGRPFIRHYHSLKQLRSRGFAVGWTHTYADQIDRPSTTRLELFSGEGSYETFRRVDDTHFRGDNASDRSIEVVTSGTVRYRLRTAGEVKAFDANGRLLAVRRPADPITDVTFAYSGDLLSSMTDAQGRVATFVHDDGLLLGIHLPDGASVSYTYDADLNLIAADYGSGQIKRYHYREPGLADSSLVNHLTGITSESGVRYASFAYDGSGRVLSSTVHGLPATITRLTYEDADRVSVQTASGERRRYTFVPGLYRRTLAVADSAGGDARTYDAEGRLKTVTDRRGVTTSYDYAASYRSATTAAVGTPQQRRVSTVRDPTSLLPTQEQVHDASNVVVGRRSWTYSAREQLLTASMLDPATGKARTTTYVYCEQADVDAAGGTCPIVGLLKTVDGPRTDVDDVTRYAYRAADDPTCTPRPPTQAPQAARAALVTEPTCVYRKGDLWKTTDALGHVTEISRYDRAGRPITVVDANGVVTQSSYDDRGWLRSRTVQGGFQPNGTGSAGWLPDATSAFEYDATGLVIKATQPDGAFTTFKYDAGRRLTGIADSLGNTVQYTLDGDGNRLREDVKDSSGALKRTLSRVYNSLGQLTTAADAQSNPTDVTYDANGNPDTTTDALRRASSNRYDPLDRLERTLADAGGIAAETRYGYDALDRLTQVIDPKGLETRYGYDGLGDLTTLASPDTGVTSHTYDSAGNRQSTRDARGVTTTYSYDALNRLTAIRYPASSLDVAFTHDVVPAACAGSGSFSKGRLSGFTDGSGSTSLCYDRFGNLIRKTQVTNGVTLTTLGTYDPAGRLLTQTTPAGTTIKYTRDAVGNIVAVRYRDAGQSTDTTLVSAVSYYPYGPVAKITYGNGRTLTRTYDQDYAIDRILGSGPGGLDLDFTTDSVNDITQVVAGTAGNNLAYDPLGRLTDVKTLNNALVSKYGYDKTGNRQSKQTASGTQGYTYPTTSHRLGAVAGVGRGHDSAGNTTTIGNRSFVYGDHGRLLTVKDGAAVLKQYAYNGKGERVRKYAGATPEHLFTYDDAGQLLGQYAPTGTSTSARVREYVWMDDLPVAMFDAAAGAAHYIEPDHLGTPRAVIDPGRNVAVWSWPLINDAFGESAANQNPDGDAIAFGQPLRFSGQFLDNETGLHYNYFRDYEAGVGRYVQSDPIGLRGGFSTYTYVKNYPIGSIDPYGLKVFVCRDPAFNGNLGPAKHYWIKTDRQEIGMGTPAAGSDAGNQYDFIGSRVETVNHARRSEGLEAECREAKGADEAIVDRLIAPGRHLGGFYPGFNDCQAFVKDTLRQANGDFPFLPKQSPIPNPYLPDPYK